MKQMAHPQKTPLARHPDDVFVYAEDLTRLSRREVVRIAISSVIGFLVVLIVLFVIGFSGSSTGI